MNLQNTLLIGLLSAVVAGGTTAVFRAPGLPADQPVLVEEPVNIDRIHFWSFTVEDIIAADPEGWQALVDRTRTEGRQSHETVEAWQMSVRHRLFEETYGRPYVPAD